MAVLVRTPWHRLTCGGTSFVEAAAHRRVHVRVQALQQLGHSVAPAREARGFAVESVWHEAPCGMHKAYNYLPAAQLAHLLRGVERAYGRLAEAPKEGALRPESMGAQSSPSVMALEPG